MKLNNCPICERHVRPDETRCPFCHAGLELQPASPSRAMLVVALGLALAACGDDKSSETTMGGSMSEASTMTTAPETGGESESETELGTSSTGSSDPTINSSGNDYAGPGGTTFETSASSSGGETETDTDASSSGGGMTDSGGQDYAGAAVDRHEVNE